ncbi:hypothetical protein [Halomonas sp. MCCC 1A11062]|uniref:hypothetical protein n=1 Tax=Halomonas sp. MCCC 1A11062 TaxID=2733485 RepID=UPI001F1A0CAB|nr:hypothetical protein [Halomonas sp. MCCC 1A11062]MCE8038512.1 hypothetical protein [Halomonas sp. MCCC 1A11062]
MNVNAVNISEGCPLWGAARIDVNVSEGCPHPHAQRGLLCASTLVEQGVARGVYLQAGH